MSDGALSHTNTESSREVHQGQSVGGTALTLVDLVIAVLRGVTVGLTLLAETIRRISHCPGWATGRVITGVSGDMEVFPVGTTQTSTGSIFTSGTDGGVTGLT